MHFPTAPGAFVSLEEDIASIVKKLDALPLEAIGQEVKTMIEELNKTIASTHQTIDNFDELIVKKFGALLLESIGEETRKIISDMDLAVQSAQRALEHISNLTKPDSVLSGEMTSTLQEIARAARNLGVLLDYLERHPEALLRRKSGESK